MIRKSIEIGPYWSFLKFQRIPKHTLSYVEWGKSSNPNIIFCVHGLARNAHDFDHIAEHLSKDYRIIAIDLPGRGKSEWLKNKNHYNYHTYVKDVLLLLKKLSITSVNWVGSSMGGIMGMIMSTYYPKYIKTLILNDVGPELPKKTIARIEKYVHLDPSFEKLSEAAQHIKRIYKNFGITSEKDWNHITQNSIRLYPDNKYRLSYDPRVTEGTSSKKASSKRDSKDWINLWYLWEKITCPVLLIHGTKSDILLASTIEKMQKSRDFDLHTIKEVGHAPALIHQPDIESIYAWLQQHTEQI